jgi:hypothetical protein
VTYYLVVTKIALFAFIVVCNVFQLQCYSNSSAKFLAQLLLLTIPSGYLVVNSALFIYIYIYYFLKIQPLMLVRVNIGLI